METGCTPPTGSVFNPRNKVKEDADVSQGSHVHQEPFKEPKQRPMWWPEIIVHHSLYRLGFLLARNASSSSHSQLPADPGLCFPASWPRFTVFDFFSFLFPNVPTVQLLGFSVRSLHCRQSRDSSDVQSRLNHAIGGYYFVL